MTGSKQHWNVADYRQFADFVPQKGEDLLQLLAAKPGERILDVGCGEGTLTEKIAAAGAQVIGVDASESMIEAAKARGLDARVMDASALTFTGAFDAVFSNAALHWVKAAQEAANGMARALKPGGRLVLEMGGEGNVATIEETISRVVAAHGQDPAALNPWFFPSPAVYGAMLKKAGFAVDRIEHFKRPTPLPGGMFGWLKTFAEPFLQAFSQAKHEPLLREIEAQLKATPLFDDKNGWVADYVRLRVVAHKA